MGTAARVAHLTVRGVGLVTLLLGLLFWGGDARGLIPLHMLLGLVVAAALLVLSVAVAVIARGTGLAAVGVTMGVLLVVVGLGQDQAFPLAYQWIAQVLHILIGMAAIGCGEVLGKRLGFARPRRAASR